MHWATRSEKALDRRYCDARANAIEEYYRLKYKSVTNNGRYLVSCQGGFMTMRTRYTKRKMRKRQIIKILIRRYKNEK